VYVTERWKNADEVVEGDIIRPLGQADFAKVVSKARGVHGDVLLAVKYDDEDWRVYDLPILAPHERVEVDPGLSAKPTEKGEHVE